MEITRAVATGGPEVGVFLSSAPADREELAGLAREAEALGFGSIWLPDHVLRVFGPVLDPLVALAFLAGVTERARLGTGVLVVPYRHPVVLANAASSLDALSGGRFVFGAGVGWNDGEFAALGVEKGERGARTEEALVAMRALWSGEPAGHDGHFFSFEDATLGTPPLTPGGPPVFVGGYAGTSFRRAARFGAGWMGFKDSPEGISKVRRSVAGHLEELGRDPSGFELATTLEVRYPGYPGDRRNTDAARGYAEDLLALGEAGATLVALSVSPAGPESLAWAAEEVVGGR
jgi:probable F420-dependent oxidoreductase